MAVDLSIMNAPDDVVRRLRARAQRHRRPLQDELLAILEAAASEEPVTVVADILAEVHRLGLRSAAEATELIRADRDDRQGR